MQGNFKNQYINRRLLPIEKYHSTNFTSSVIANYGFHNFFQYLLGGNDIEYNSYNIKYTYSE